MKLAIPESQARRGSGGFSLIEILIATTILLVIVVLASMVFQQTTGAYQTGERKVNAQVALRNVLGSITRDLALAVDSSKYEGLNVNSIGNGHAVTFLALTGTPGVDKGKVVRTVQKISYSFAGGVVKRTEQNTTVEDGTWKTTGNAVEAELNDGNENPLTDFSFESVGDGNLPECVVIRAEMETKDKISSVGAGSGGKRGWGYEDDDIYVGFNPNKER